MTDDKQWILESIQPKRDQLNADDLISGPITVRITGVKRGSKDQPVALEISGYEGRPYKPCKSMRRVLVALWGDDPRNWLSRSLTLYCDQDVVFGGVKVGGIRISHMSHIERATDVQMTVTRGKRGSCTIQPLQVDAPKIDLVEDAKSRISAASTLEKLAELQSKIKASAKFTNDQKADLQELVSIRSKELA